MLLSELLKIHLSILSFHVSGYSLYPLLPIVPQVTPQ